MVRMTIDYWSLYFLVHLLNYQWSQLIFGSVTQCIYKVGPSWWMTEIYSHLSCLTTKELTSKRSVLSFVLIGVCFEINAPTPFIAIFIPIFIHLPNLYSIETMFISKWIPWWVRLDNQKLYKDQNPGPEPRWQIKLSYIVVDLFYKFGFCFIRFTLSFKSIWSHAHRQWVN